MQLCLVENESLVVRDVRTEGGTLKEILEWVVYSGEETHFFTFLSTYRAFTTGSEVCNMWKEIYSTYKLKSVPHSCTRRLYLFLKYWVDTFPDDFKAKGLFNDLLVFANRHLSKREVNTIKLTFVKTPNVAGQRGVNSPRDLDFVDVQEPLALPTRTMPHRGHSRKNSLGTGIHIPLLSLGSPKKTNPGMASPSSASLRQNAASRSGLPSPGGPFQAPQSPHKSVRTKVPHVYIEDLSATEIAVHLTMIEFGLFEKLRPEEFLGMNWQKEGKEELAPNITALTKRFNQVSFWVATEVVTAPTQKQRVDILRKFIKCGKRLHALNNYNSLMEIVAGLNNSSVQRMKSLWAALPANSQADFDALDMLMSPHQNFKSYREEMKVYPQPAIPYIAPVLRDITFIYDGNKVYISPGNVNYDLLELLGHQVKEILRFQKERYDLSVDDCIYNYLSNIRSIDEEILRKFSLKAEPPDLSNSELSRSDTDLSSSYSSPSSPDVTPDTTPREGPVDLPVGYVAKRSRSIGSLSKETSNIPAGAVSPRSNRNSLPSPYLYTKETASWSRERIRSHSISESTTAGNISPTGVQGGKTGALITGKRPRPKASPKDLPDSPRTVLRGVGQDIVEDFPVPLGDETCISGETEKDSLRTPRKRETERLRNEIDKMKGKVLGRKKSTGSTPREGKETEKEGKSKEHSKTLQHANLDLAQETLALDTVTAIEKKKQKHHSLQSSQNGEVLREGADKEARRKSADGGGLAGLGRDEIQSFRVPRHQSASEELVDRTHPLMLQSDDYPDEAPVTDDGSSLVAHESDALTIGEDAVTVETEGKEEANTEVVIPEAEEAQFEVQTAPIIVLEESSTTNNTFYADMKREFYESLERVTLLQSIRESGRERKGRKELKSPHRSGNQTVTEQVSVEYGVQYHSSRKGKEKKEKPSEKGERKREKERAIIYREKHKEIFGVEVEVVHSVDRDRLNNEIRARKEKRKHNKKKKNSTTPRETTEGSEGISKVQK